jgi:hypothetical protein
MAFTFKDSTGKEWDLKIQLGIVNRLRDAGVIDLMKVTANKMERFKKLMSDPCDLAGVVWALLQPQAAAANVDFETFMGALDGDSIDAMMEAFSRSLADFFPALRNLILKGLEKGKQTNKLANEGAMAALEKIDPAKLVAATLAKAQEEIDQMMASPGIASPGSAAQDSDTTPNLTPSPSP